MDKMETAVLLSGGLDSSVALHWAHRNHRVRVALSFDYASNHAERELKCAAWQAASLGIEHRVIDISSISSHLKSALLSGADDIPDGSYDEELMKQTVVPFRNGIFLSIAAGVAESCGAQQLVIAAHSGDHSIYPDCREEFMAAMTEAIRLGTYAGLGILRPFIHMSKGGIAAMGQDLGVDFSRTYSCYKGGAVHCGVCSTCMERREGFRKYIQKGRRFLEKGINANPDSWYLQSLLGNMYSDTYRQPDFEKAAEAYRKARDLGAPPLTARKEFYALVRVPSKSREALELGRELFKDPRNRTPSLVSNIFVLENRLNIPEKERIPFRELFPTDEIARDLMTSHLANSLKYPVDGLREALESLPPAKDE